MPIGAIIGCAVAFGIVLIALCAVAWGIRKANYFRRMQVKIKEAASDIDVALQKRYDLLAKQVDVVKGYTKHESNTLLAIVNSRSHATSKDAPNISNLSKLNAELDAVGKEISLVVEQYPDLKANSVFLSLQNSCVDVEEHLQASRRLYNSNVSLYNQEIVVFPSSIIAGMIHAQSEVFFEVDAAEKRGDYKIEL